MDAQSKRQTGTRPVKTIFTIRDVGKICNVSRCTVQKWFDSGRLVGYRHPGNRGERRIKRRDLVHFLKEHGMPTDDLDAETRTKVLLIGCELAAVGEFQRYLSSDDYVFETASGAFEAGIWAESLNPSCFVIDFAIGFEDATSIARRLFERPEYRRARRIGLIDQQTDPDFVTSLFDELFRKPFDWPIVAERLLRAGV